MLFYDLDRTSDACLYESLYESLKRDIASGVIAANQHLPSKREFARELGVSVITIEHAYQQLIAEGYVRSQQRRGYFANDLGISQHGIALRNTQCPHSGAHGLRSDMGRPHSRTDVLGDFRAAKIGMGCSNPDESDPLPSVEFDFMGRSGAPDSFPIKAMQLAIRECQYGACDNDLLSTAPPRGLLRLRRAIARHVRQIRGIKTTPEQIVIGAGAQHLYGMLAQLLADFQHASPAVAIEDPGYLRLSDSYELAGVSVARIPLDSKGMSSQALAESGASIAHISPSHQFPTGTVMPISRRYELLSWAANQSGRFIIEDDFDCEFRYSGKPIPALQSVDAMGKVIYLNTFTRTMGPGFRMGYMILPEELSAQFDESFGPTACFVPNFNQVALAAFLESGEYERRLNRLKRAYRQSHDAIIDVFESAGLPIRVDGQGCGLHLVLSFPNASPGSADRLAQMLVAKGIAIRTVADYRRLEKPGQDSCEEGLVANFAGLSTEQAILGSKRIADELRKALENGILAESK